MAKRKSDSDKDDALLLSDILESSPKAKVQCLVTVLSDMKKSRDTSYFDGEISDGKTSMLYAFFFDRYLRLLRNWSHPWRPYGLVVP